MAHPTDFYWYANTDADITFSQDGKSALLEIDGERMLARIIKAPQNASFTYSVSDENIATVSPAGEITFHKAGETRITITGEQNGMRVTSGVFLKVE